MEILYSDADLVAAYRQKRSILIAYILICVVYAAIVAGNFVWYIGMQYEDPLQIYPKLIVCTLTCVFIAYSYVFLGIKWQRSRKYTKLVADISSGRKADNTSYFLRYEDDETNGSVDYCVLIMCEWSRKRDQYLDRKIYCDKEKECPVFESGDRVHYLTHGNVLIAYETAGHDESFVAERAREKERGEIRM